MCQKSRKRIVELCVLLYKHIKPGQKLTYLYKKCWRLTINLYVLQQLQSSNDYSAFVRLFFSKASDTKLILCIDLCPTLKWVCFPQLSKENNTWF